MKRIPYATRSRLRLILVGSGVLLAAHTLVVAWPDIESLVIRIRSPGWCQCPDCKPIMRFCITPLGWERGFADPVDWYLRTTLLVVLFAAAGLSVGAWYPAYRPGYCSHCGYDLRGLSKDARCPECGWCPKPEKRLDGN